MPLFVKLISFPHYTHEGEYHTLKLGSTGRYLALTGVKTASKRDLHVAVIAAVYGAATDYKVDLHLLITSAVNHPLTTHLIVNE